MYCIWRTTIYTMRNLRRTTVCRKSSWRDDVTEQELFDFFELLDWDNFVSNPLEFFTKFFTILLIEEIAVSNGTVLLSCCCCSFYFAFFIKRQISWECDFFVLLHFHRRLWSSTRHDFGGIHIVLLFFFRTSNEWNEFVQNMKYKLILWQMQ